MKEVVSNLESTELKLYSKTVITVFTILFSAFFGALLLVFNLRRLHKKKAAVLVFLFGLVYTLASFYVLNLLENSTVLTIVINAIGAGILIVFFWKNNIEDTTKFEARQWGLPALLILGSLVFTFLVYVYWFQVFASIFR